MEVSILPSQKLDNLPPVDQSIMKQSRSVLDVQKAEEMNLSILSDVNNISVWNKKNEEHYEEEVKTKKNASYYF